MNKRNTLQKQLVLDAVRALADHATAEEVYQRIQADQPRVSKATVYRNLGILAEEGKIRKIEIPGAADCYDHRLGEHYHIQCVRCGRVFDVAMEPLPDMRESVADTWGFDFLGYELIFRGVCPECKRATEEKQSAE